MGKNGSKSGVIPKDLTPGSKVHFLECLRRFQGNFDYPCTRVLDGEGWPGGRIGFESANYGWAGIPLAARTWPFQLVP